MDEHDRIRHDALKEPAEDEAAERYLSELREVNEQLLISSLREQELSVSLDAERAQLAMVLAGIGDAVLVVDPTGEIVRANPAYARLAGGTLIPLSPQDGQGQPLPPNATPQARAGRGEVFSLEFTLTEAGGKRRWYEANGQPLHDSGLQVGVVVIHDTTPAHEQRRLQDEFLALAGHELRTPLTAAGGYLDLLLRRLRGRSEEERVVSYAVLAREQLLRLRVLIRDLTDVTRFVTGKLTLELGPVEVNTLVAQVTQTAQNLPPGHIVNFDQETGPLHVYGDASRLEQALLNLLTNAFTHAPSDAPVVIRLRRVNEEIALSVQDHGPGIADDQLPHLFSRFYQVARPRHAATEGLGLGLFIAREVIEAQGGRITVLSREGVGSTFTIWLPLAAVDPPLSGPATGSAAPSPDYS